MERINRENYEVYFLDYAEGNLTEPQIEELKAFLMENPDLAEELESFETLSLLPPQVENDWQALKKSEPAEVSDINYRDRIFVRAIENELSADEAVVFAKLITNPEYKSEFELWKQVKLQPGAATVNKDALFQFGLEREISAFNFEYFLIARAEGLLSEEQNEGLDKYVRGNPELEVEMRMADSLKLKPAMAVFYPDKNKLYRRKKAGAIIWLYRASAIAAAVLLAFFVFRNENNQPAVQPIAGTVQIDTVNAGSSKPEDSLSTEPKVKSEAPLLEDWEIREPDAVEYAEKTTEKEPLPKATLEESLPENDLANINPVRLKLEKTTHIEIEADQEKPLTSNDDALPPIEVDQNAVAINSTSTKNPYKTVPELAEDILARKMNLTDEERDAMAMTVAKKLTDKASEFLDAEVSKTEEQVNDVEQLTYTLRIGSFKVKHTRSK